MPLDIKYQDKHLRLTEPKQEEIISLSEMVMVITEIGDHHEEFWDIKVFTPESPKEGNEILRSFPSQKIIITEVTPKAIFYPEPGLECTLMFV